MLRLILGSSYVSIRLGDGQGGFSGTTNVTVGTTPLSVAVGDFNGDGHQDIATANRDSNTGSIRLGDGQGGFSGSTEIAVGSQPISVAVGDFNGDGHQDIATVNPGSDSVSIRLGAIAEINLKGNSIDIASGDNSPSVADNTDFGSGGNTTIRTFTISNTGTAALTIESIGISGADASKFLISAIVLPITLAGGTETTFNIVSKDYSAVLKTATIAINNNSCDESAYIFAIQAGSIIPALGVYSDAMIANAGGSTLVTPSVIPSGTNFSVYTTTNFKGTLAVNNTTGVLSITNAHPAGIYPVTVNAEGVLYNFTLTVGNPLCSQGQFYAPATPEVAVGSSPQSVAIGDFNGDGIQDIATANYDSNTVSIRLGDGQGGFSGTTNVAVGSRPNSVAVGDFNGDGHQDIVTANISSNSVSIRLGDGQGGFSGTTNVAVGLSPHSVAVGDFNGDGHQDIATANRDSNTGSIRLGDGQGGFSGTTNVAVGSHPISVAVGDFNGDGKQDIAVANSISNSVSIRLGDGQGGFSGTTESCCRIKTMIISHRRF